MRCWLAEGTERVTSALDARRCSRCATWSSTTRPAACSAAGAPPVRAVDGVSFEVGRGETLALVGESGCGKSSVGRTILRLQEPTSGQAIFDGIDVFALGPQALRRLRRRMQIIFQDPVQRLNPRMTVGAAWPRASRSTAGAAGRDRAAGWPRCSRRSGSIPATRGAIPTNSRGGQRQRIGIARALAVEPAFIVCDEPVSALDVSVQAQVLNLLADLQRDRGLSYLFIAHDLAVVRQIAQRVAVMYLGRIVEAGPDRGAALRIRGIPTPWRCSRRCPSRTPPPPRRASCSRGDLPSPSNPPPGCPFHTRCFHPGRERAVPYRACRCCGRSAATWPRATTPSPRPQPRRPRPPPPERIAGRSTPSQRECRHRTHVHAVRTLSRQCRL